MRDLSGNYHLIRELGRGGMGQVWRAVRHGREGILMPCAIKVLHPSLAQTETERQRFYNEARIAAQLEHGRIVKVTDTSEVQGSPCLVMEWVDGVNLRDFTEKVRKPLDLDVCLFVIGEVLAALEYAHDRTIAGADAGVIHYDVTPGNVLISSSGEVKLTDFGIARFSSAADGTMSRSMGTPRYMSAEQISGKACKETDIYSLGVVLHELLTGRRYLDGCDRQQLQMLVLDGYIPELERPSTPPWVDQLRRSMLAGNASERPRATHALAVILQNTPGYNLAGKQLRQLYIDHVGDPRSGFTELVDTEDVPGVFRRRPPVPVPEQSLAPAAGVSQGITKTRSPAFDAPITVTEVLPPPPESPSPTPVPPVDAAPPITSVPERRWLFVALAVSCLLLTAVVGILTGMLVSQRQAEVVAVEPRGPTLAEDRAPEISDPAPIQNPTEALPRSEPDEVVEPEQPRALEPTSPPEPEPKPPPEPKAKPEPKPSEVPPEILVTFLITGVGAAELKVGRESVKHDNYAAHELPPGRYPVRWRTSSDEEWHDAGTMVVKTLPKDNYYEVHVGTDSLRVIKRDEGSAN